ncbi:hypothetical protein ACFQ3Z_15890 [Streptomyces nogalater]
MERHTAESTEWILAQGIADEIAARASGADVVLVDRAPTTRSPTGTPPWSTGTSGRSAGSVTASSPSPPHNY